MASPTQWTQVWASSGSCWWTGKCGVLHSLVSKRVRHDWATELEVQAKEKSPFSSLSLFTPQSLNRYLQNMSFLITSILKTLNHSICSPYFHLRLSIVYTEHNHQGCPSKHQLTHMFSMQIWWLSISLKRVNPKSFSCSSSPYMMQLPAASMTSFLSSYQTPAPPLYQPYQFFLVLKPTMFLPQSLYILFPRPVTLSCQKNISSLPFSLHFFHKMSPS